MNGPSFEGIKAGGNNLKELKRKDGKKMKDLDYIELLGRHCKQLDKENPNPNIPTNYGEGYDLNVVNFAKQVVEAIDEGYNRRDLEKYIANSITL